MGRLFLFAIGLLAFGITMARSRPQEQRFIPTASFVASSDPAPAATIAYRPGEPMLSPGAVELRRGSNGHFTSGVSVNGQMIEMVVDTGATVVALTVDDARRLGIAVDPATFQVVGTGASGPVRGVATVLNDVALGDRHVGQVAAVVLEGLDRSLLGQSFLRRLERVAIDGDVMTLR